MFFDAEHFFDGFKRNPEFSLRVVEAAAMAAEAVVRATPTAGRFPDVEAAVGAVIDHVDCEVGIHLHNDTGCGVANALAAVRGGATQVQGTINGYGERVGNCDLVPIMANLEFKMGIECLPQGRLANLTSVAHHVAELRELLGRPAAAVRARRRLSHTRQVCTSALSRASDAYEHVDPEAVGNGTRVLVSEMAGRSTLEMKAETLGIELDGKTVGDIIDTLKLEHEGYHFERLMRRSSCSCVVLLVGSSRSSTRIVLGRHRSPVRHQRPPVERRPVDVETSATVKVWVDDTRHLAVGEGNGRVTLTPPCATPSATSTRRSTASISPTSRFVSRHGQGHQRDPVLLDSTDGSREWTTIGVSENIIEAHGRPSSIRWSTACFTPLTEPPGPG